MEDLLDQLVAKKSTAEYGTDNISAILIKFAKFKNYLSIFLLYYLLLILPYIWVILSTQIII